MNKATNWGWIFLLAIGMAFPVQAVEIALWNSIGADPLAGNYAPLSQDGNVSVSNLVAGVALQRSGSSPAASTFAAAGYSTASSNEAMTAGHYWETSIKANTGFALVLDTIQFRLRSSGSWPKTSQWAYSLNGSSYTWLVPTNAVIDSYANDRYVTLTDISALQNATNRIWFRMYAWGGTNTPTSWGSFGKTNVLIFSGTVVSLTGSPVVNFNPNTNASVHVSNVLDVAVALSPSGSGIQQWWVTPTPAGTTNFSAGTFHFTPAAADEGGTFTLNVLATNAYGATTGSLAIAVTEYLPPGSYEITFENTGETKTSYNLGTVTLNGRPWIMDQAVIGTSDSDVKIGARAARFGSFYPAIMTSSNTLLPAGLGVVSFLYAQYATSNETPAGAELVVEVATNSAAGDWLEVGRVDANGVTSLTAYETAVRVNQPMYVRIRTDYHEGVGQVNVDNIVVRPYAAATHTAYEQYLLNYNVTPGDAGTAEGEDWDGDGATNLQEFNALTNPYDPSSHP